MTRLTFICALILLVSSCKSKHQVKTAIITGTVSSDIEQVEFERFKKNLAVPTAPTYIAKVDSAGHFTMEIPMSGISKGMMICNNNRNSLVLIPGDKLNITIDGDSLHFAGKGAERNSFLYQLEKVKKISKNNIMHSWYSKGHKLDSMFLMAAEYFDIRTGELAKFKESHKQEDVFSRFFEIETKLQHIYLLNNAPLAYSRKTKQDIDSLQLPDGANKYKTFASIQNDEYLQCSDYIYLFRSLIKEETKKRMAKDSTLDKKGVNLNVIMDSLSGKTRENYILFEIYFNLSYRKIDDPKLIEAFYEISTDANCKEFVDRELGKYKAKKAMIGATLHQDILETVLFDSNEKEITMADMLAKYKGKVVYLDIWSLGCGPCHMSMPHSKKLKEALTDKPIEFVYITVDKKSDKLWPEVYKVSQTEENHYRFKKGFDSKLHQLLSIIAVPTYLLIDKEGNLVSYNADKPYKAELKEQLLNLAAK